MNKSNPSAPVSGASTCGGARNIIKGEEDKMIHVMCEWLRDGGFIEDVLRRNDDEVDRKIQSWRGSQEDAG